MCDTTTPSLYVETLRFHIFYDSFLLRESEGKSIYETESILNCYN